MTVTNLTGGAIEFPLESGNWHSGKGKIVYEGSFWRGSFHGNGTLTSSDGREYNGNIILRVVLSVVDIY
jgi:hypothetical protein